jgi:hypothetical protein
MTTPIIAAAYLLLTAQAPLVGDSTPAHTHAAKPCETFSTNMNPGYPRHLPHAAHHRAPYGYGHIAIRWPGGYHPHHHRHGHHR